MKKRMLSVLLCLCLALGLLPGAALAQSASYVALGDSISTGYGLAHKDTESFPTIVARERGYTLTNLAADGETSASLLAKLQAPASAELAAVKTADVVTITIGGNDLMNALYAYVAKRYNTANQDTEGFQEINAAGVQTALMSGDLTMLSFAVNTVSAFTDPQNLSAEASAALAQLGKNLADIITVIKKENPNVTVVVANQYNPYSYLAKSAEGSFLAAYAGTIAAAFENGLTALNQTIAAGAAAGGYTVADVHGKFKAAVEAGKNPCNASASPVNLDFHPNAAGHSLLAEVMAEVLKNSSIQTGGTTTDSSADAVTVAGTVGGTVTVSAGQTTQGSTVTLTAVPDGGYTLDSLSAADSRGNAVALTDLGGGQYTFTMPDSKVTVTAVFRETAAGTLPFADVPAGAWYESAVRYVYKNGLMNGTGTTVFAPDSSTSRSMIATILWRMTGSPVVNYAMSFADVEQGAWYAEAVRWAASEGIITGYSDTAFGPDDAVTREDLAVMLYRWAQSKGYDVSVGENVNILSYTDAAEVHEYAVPALQWACGAGIVNGTDGRLAPRSGATRAELATMLMRLYENIIP